MAERGGRRRRLTVRRYVKHGRVPHASRHVEDAAGPLKARGSISIAPDNDSSHRDTAVRHTHGVGSLHPQNISFENVVFSRQGIGAEAVYHGCGEGGVAWDTGGLHGAI